MHEKYYKLNNDIALLKLSSPFRINAKVNTVCLPRHGSRAHTGSKCYVTGWGRLSGYGLPAVTLQQAVLTIADDAKCQKRNNELLTVDSNSMVCAGTQGKGGCEGDSGGPLVCKERGWWVLRGATSWGHPRCRTDYYTVFARISSFVNWINGKIGRGSGGNGGGSTGGICLDRDIRCPDLTHRCSSPYVMVNCRRSCRLCRPAPH